MDNHQARLAALRQVLKQMRLDAFIVPHNDRWMSESPHPRDLRLNYLCGLDASAGYVVVTADDAVVLIDERYTVVARQQVDPGLYETAYYTDSLPEIWAIAHLPAGAVVGYDPWLHTRREAKRMHKALLAAGLSLEPVKRNPVDKIWQGQPADIKQTAKCHELKFAGQSTAEKLDRIAGSLTEDDIDSCIITAPDSLAWLLNLRVLDHPQTPGLRGFAVFQTVEKMLNVFTDVDCACFDKKQAGDYRIAFNPLSDLGGAISYFERIEQTVLIGPDAPDWFTEHLNSPANILIEKPDPCALPKACKNPVEQDGIRAAHRRDAVAVMKTLQWVKSAGDITERDVEHRLAEERAKANMFRGISFQSIVGWNENGAAIHRHLTDDNNTAIEGEGLLLIDSGGQYDDGTTDITRTIAIGTPTEDMRRKYTHVLKSHIALARAIFPDGTTGVQLDALVRAVLWREGMDFAHGTGHGVGYFLNVHEGPANLSPRSNEPLKPGMLLSNEPGYYKEGGYGIRLENLMLVQEYLAPGQPGNETGKPLYCFETVTLVPFDEDCIVYDLLTDEESRWLADYNARIEKEVRF